MNNIQEFKEFLKENGCFNNFVEENGKVKVGGWLDLRGTQITSLPENLTVEGNLYLRETQITTLPENLTVGGGLDLSDTQITSLPENLTVGGGLDLRGTQITSLPENLTVGGSLDLRGTQITSLPDNLTVGGWLNLRRTQITSLPDNLTVGGGLYLSGTQITNKEKAVRNVKKLTNGYCKERNYIFFDGILWGNVKSVKIRENITIYKTPLGYCVVENEVASHGKTLKEAIDDLTFKKIKNEEVKNIVKEIKKTGKVNKAQYRAITGACQYGTNKFCEEHNITVEEIELTELKKILKPNDYGAKKFWNLIDNEV